MWLPPGYNVSKFGVVALSETLHHDLAITGSKLKVSVLCPGWVNTKIIDANRNRPAELSKTVAAIPDAQREAMDTAVRNFLKTGLEPSAVAEQVFEAIREDQLYIITHPEMDFIFRERFDNILSRTNPTPRTLG